MIQANTKHFNNVVTTSLQRRDVAATLLRRCVFAGIHYADNKDSAGLRVHAQGELRIRCDLISECMLSHLRL